jgi:xanthine dehydrogenase YagS FAD-binding subunit
MRAFTYQSADSAREAIDGANLQSSFIAGGTTLVDLMKLEVMTPSKLIDINNIPARGIEMGLDYLRIGSLEKMSDVAEHPDVKTYFPVVSQALLKSASAQLRNMATIGGNILQRTRCGYFRDVAMACNKRQSGSGCAAIEGNHRMHAIFGTSHSCIATHPSDLAVALVALDASIKLQNKGGERVLKLDDFYLLPGDTPNLENQLKPGELITEIQIPKLDVARRSLYLKIRDRESYEFALTSAAVAVALEGQTVRDARVAVGGVGTKPWNLPQVAKALIGKSLDQGAIEASSRLAAEGAHPLEQNGFKVELIQRTVIRALMSVGGLI